jgi:hypothetical protein
MRKIIGVLGVLVILSACAGCAQVGVVLANDAKVAAQINPVNGACYTALGDLGTAQANITGKTGVLTIVATKQQLAGVLESPVCATLVTAVLAELLKLGVPGAAFILP